MEGGHVVKWKKSYFQLISWSFVAYLYSIAFILSLVLFHSFEENYYE